MPLWTPILTPARTRTLVPAFQWVATRVCKATTHAWLAWAVATGALAADRQTAPTSQPTTAYVASTPTAAHTDAVPDPGPTRVLHIRVVGGLDKVPQFKQFEEPFWRDQLAALTQGRVQATVVPFDRAGIRAHEVMRLMTLGVVPFGTALLSNVMLTDPELAAMDLAGANPDMATLRRSVAALRPHLEASMRERHGIEVLAVYVYPAQVVFCAQPFTGLSDLGGRRVRISNPSQGDLIRPFGAQPVTTEFSQIVDQVRRGNLDCAITGGMSGHAIGLAEVTSHISPVAVNWGLSVFGANVSAWKSLPADVRTVLRTELPRLEAAIWADAERQTEQGMRCNTGAAACPSGKPGRLQLVSANEQDAQRLREAFRTSVLPSWLQRCGPGCGEVWNRWLAAPTGVALPKAPRSQER